MTAASRAIVVIDLPCAGSTLFTITPVCVAALGELVFLSLSPGYAACSILET